MYMLATSNDAPTPLPFPSLIYPFPLLLSSM